MSGQLFDVVFFGILQTGRDKETVMQNMATLFKTDANKLAPYFAGGRKVIKEKINADSAEKYKAALENVGLVITIEACKSTQNEGANEPAQTQANEAAIDTGGLTLAPVGTNVLEHPVKVIPQKIEDISNLTLAEAGANIIANPKPKEKAVIPDISELSLA